MAASSRRSGDDHRRGRHQRARVDVPAEELPIPRVRFVSEMAMYLLQEWSWGRLTAPEVNRHALKSYRDQVRLLKSLGISEDKADSDLRDLAKLGSWGKHVGNIHPELMKWLGPPTVPAPFKWRVPVRRIKPDGTAASSTVELAFPIFLPHELFAWYFNHDQQRFKELFLGETDAHQRRAFWNELKNREDPRLVDHPMCRTANWEELVLPLSFHGDGVPVLRVGRSASQSLDVYSIQSIYASGSTVNIKMFM